MGFLTEVHGPQHPGIPVRYSPCRSRTEEARGSNPLTSTPETTGQSVVSFERAALTARCGRTAAASASPSPAGKALSDTRLGPGPPMMTTEGGRRFQPELRVARQAGLEGHCGSGRWSSRSRDTAGGPGPGPPGRAVARRTRRAPRVTGADTADAERPDTDTGRRTSTPGHWTPNAWTSRARTLDGHTGHRTPDTGHDRLRGQGA